MKRLLIGISAASSMAVICPVWAQVLPATYPDPNTYRLVASTPEDAYRAHLINRMELERLTGPIPQALQGPSPNGDQELGSR